MKYPVTNTSGWESGTRPGKDNNNDGRHDEIIPDKQKGYGVNIGGNFTQIRRWEEIVN